MVGVDDSNLCLWVVAVVLGCVFLALLLTIAGLGFDWLVGDITLLLVVGLLLPF